MRQLKSVCDRNIRQYPNIEYGTIRAMGRWKFELSIFISSLNFII